MLKFLGINPFFFWLAKAHGAWLLFILVLGAFSWLIPLKRKLWSTTFSTSWLILSCLTLEEHSTAFLNLFYLALVPSSVWIFFMVNLPFWETVIYCTSFVMVIDTPLLLHRAINFFSTSCFSQVLSILFFISSASSQFLQACSLKIL